MLYSQKMEGNQVSIDRWMDNVYPWSLCDGILFSFKNEGNSDACYNMDDLWGHYVKQNKPVTLGQHCVILLTWCT